MKLSRWVAAGLLALTSVASADSGVTKLWETAADFKTPESVLYDARLERLYVSNIDGEAMGKDGKGFISILGMDGKIQQLQWVAGLNAPKGLALVGDRLYVADIDELVEIDVVGGAVVQRYAAAGAKFLNDVSADAAGNVYVSDMMTNRIHRLKGGRFEVWLESPQLDNPNGLSIVGDKMYLGAWGVMDKGFATTVPGRVKIISLTDKAISEFAGSAPVGNLDGIEVLPDGRVLATDWMAGGLMLLSADGKVQVLDKLAPGSADLGFVPSRKMVLVPMMHDGKVIAFRLDIN